MHAGFKSGCSRRTFLVTSIGVGAVALLPSCGPAAVAPDGTVAVSGGKALLPFAQFPALASPGGGVTVATTDGVPFAVVRTGVSSAVALNAVCTHEGCTATYEQSQMDLACACHGSHFALSGAVTHGPAELPLMTYLATVGADGITVVIEN